MNKKLAKIRSASLEIKERGILNFWIHVDYEEGLSQGVGGICLDSYDKDKKTRIGTAFGCEIIRQILLCLNVNDFSEMKGKYIWVIGEGDGLRFSPKGIAKMSIEGGKVNQVIWDDIIKDFNDE